MAEKPESFNGHRIVLLRYFQLHNLGLTTPKERLVYMSVNLDWKNLSFSYMDTGSFVKISFKDGAWQEIELCTNPQVTMHIASTCLHYGQECFEGLKVFTLKDGSIASFRPEENALRLIDSAERLVMEPPPVELFMAAMKKAVHENRDYVPPYGTGASMYVRPLLLGSSPHVGVNPSENYDFYMLVMPVGPYYKNGFLPISAFVQEAYDRAAPSGVGHVKAGGNYGAGMKAFKVGKEKGFPICLFLDSATHSYIDEFNTSNFIGITKDNKYITPDSPSILPSITNKSLQVLAKDCGLTVEKRPIHVDELDTFVEVGACGTAAVITPIYSITRGDKTYTYGEKDNAGETLTKLYNELQGIQYGDIEDRHNWMIPID